VTDRPGTIARLTDKANAVSTTVRMHDIDVPSLSRDIHLESIVEAIGGALRRRETEMPTEMPVGLTEVFATIAEERRLWTGFLRRSPPAMEPPAFRELQDELRRFFGTITASLSSPEGENGCWNRNAGAWCRLKENGLLGALKLAMSESCSCLQRVVAKALWPMDYQEMIPNALCTCRRLSSWQTFRKF